VRLHLRSDVPLGLFLSGGIDSAAMLALMSQMEPGKIKTFSVGYDVGHGTASPDDETLHARRIATHFDADHHERIITANDWWNFLLAYVYHHDEPNANPSSISLQALTEIAAQHVKVVLNGTGGDELFCGYRSHRRYPWVIRNAARMDRIVPRGIRRALIGQPWKHLEALYPAMRRVPFLGALPAYLPEWHALFLPTPEGLRRLASFEGLVHSDSLRARLYGPALGAAWQGARHKEHAYQAILERAWTDDLGDLTQALIIYTWLPGNGLLAVDKVTMAHSLEARVPFFDPPLMEFAMQIPSALRLRSNKFVLREAVRPYLPSFALDRPKQPFGTPILHWFDHDLAERIRAVLLDERSLGRDLFKRTALETLLNKHFSGQIERVEIVFRLLLLELWQQATIDAPPHIPEVVLRSHG
jgi:asparagine synthase (glutamine-hydrolysing)